MSTPTTQNITNNIRSFLESQLSFWFRNPGPASLAELLIIIFIFSFIVILGATSLIYNRWKIGDYRPKNKIVKPAGVGLVYIGLSGLITTLFRWQGIDFMGARFFPLLFFTFAIVWIGFFAYLYQSALPTEIIKYEAGLVKKKYLTKNKRSKP